jgi:hypothetical protein
MLSLIDPSEEVRGFWFQDTVIRAHCCFLSPGGRKHQHFCPCRGGSSLKAEFGSLLYRMSCDGDASFCDLSSVGF